MENTPVWIGYLVLILGIVYLLADFGTFNFPVSWWSSLFILGGLACVMSQK